MVLLTDGYANRVLLTRISCHAALDIAACAAFLNESRMKCANATGNPGHAAFVAGSFAAGAAAGAGP
jgi:hypothetical protein